MSQAQVDLERVKFLQKLDKSDVDVTDWEAQFIASTLEKTFFTPKQREVVDKLIDRYGSRIKW